MYVLVTYKDKENQMENEGAKVVTKLSINFKRLKGRKLHNKWWDLDGIQTHPSFYSCPSYLQEWIWSIQKWKH